MLPKAKPIKGPKQLARRRQVYAVMAMPCVVFGGFVGIGASVAVNDVGGPGRAPLFVIIILSVIALIPLSIGAVLVFRAGRLRVVAGRCVGCGYDLRHSGGRCPECGADDQPGDHPDGSARRWTRFLWRWPAIAFFGSIALVPWFGFTSLMRSETLVFVPFIVLTWMATCAIGVVATVILLLRPPDDRAMWRRAFGFALFLWVAGIVGAGGLIRAIESSGAG